MSYSADQFGMSVYIPGSSRVVENTYTGDGSTTFAKGDLVRVDTSGQIVDAATDSDTTGPCHGMILDDYSTAPATSAYVTILEFGADTELMSQLYAAAAADAEPQDVTVGVSYELRNGSAGIWCVTTTSTKGIAMLTRKIHVTKWFEEDADEDYGLVCVRFTQANLDAHGA